MNLISKTSQFIQLKLNGFSFKTSAQCFKSPLTVGDYYTLVMLACVAAIIVVLRFADYIDGVQKHAENMRQAAEHNQAESIRREEIIVSMLNGGVIINGRKVTFCMVGAGGECKK